MPSDKDRLYVVLYIGEGKPKMPDGEDAYHWALVVGPKHEKEESRGHRFNVKEGWERHGDGDASELRWTWKYEHVEIDMKPTSKQLVRILIAKIEDKERLQQILEQVPVQSEIEGWNCVVWMKDAVTAALIDGKALGTHAGNWGSVKDTAMRYVERKKTNHRFDGQVPFDPTKAATWDMLENTELID